jgi:hypothetical protein
MGRGRGDCLRKIGGSSELRRARGGGEDMGWVCWALCHGRQDMRCTIDGIKTNGWRFRSCQALVGRRKRCPGMIKASEVAVAFSMNRQRLSDIIRKYRQRLIPWASGRQSEGEAALMIEAASLFHHLIMRSRRCRLLIGMNMNQLLARRRLSQWNVRQSQSRGR